MANDVTGNTSEVVAQIFTDEFEKNRVLTKTVNTQIIQGLHSPMTGDVVFLKRPHQYKSKETTTGDLTGLNRNELISGRAAATVQNYITVDIEWTNKEEALELNQLREIIAPAAEELVTTFETNLNNFMNINSGLSYGTPGTVVDAWSDVSGAGALMKSIGVPSAGNSYYAMNPFSQNNLADAQSGLTSADSLVRTAWENAQISGNFGGLRSLMSNSMSTYQAGADAGNSSGTLDATPDATYDTHKDTMIQTLALTGLTINITDALRPGDILEFTGTGADARSYVNVKTRNTAFGAAGAPLKWRCTVVTGGSTDGSGEVTITVTNAAIFGSVVPDSQYTNISAPLVSGDAFTILGVIDTTYQNQLFYHENAYAVGTVSLPKLSATDTTAETEDGISIRVTKDSNSTANTQFYRVDLLPAFSAMNPLFAGKGFGVP
jgi:hypothetical protein